MTGVSSAPSHLIVGLNQQRTDQFIAGLNQRLNDLSCVEAEYETGDF